MKPYTWLVLFSLYFDTSVAAPQDVVRWDEATEHVRDTVTVCGPAAFAGRIALTDNSAALILGGEPIDRASGFRDDSRFKVVFLDYHDGFEQDLASHYLGKETCVVGTILWAMAGGVEILPTNPSQVALRSEGLPTMPAGAVASLPSGAVSYMDARDYIGEAKSVCGTVVAVWPNVPPNKTLNSDFKLPPMIVQPLVENAHGLLLGQSHQVKYQ